jgi:hypothetical protein
MTFFKTKAHSLPKIKLRKSLVPKVYIINCKIFNNRKNEFIKNIYKKQNAI